MIIQTEQTMDEVVNCCVRAYWLQKDSKKKLFINILTIPLMWTIYTWFFDYSGKSLLSGIFFTLIYGSYLYYAYTKGYRKKVEKKILANLGNQEFPREVEIEITDNELISRTHLGEMKTPWHAINAIQQYKNYIEFHFCGNLLQLDQDKSPSLEELHKIWNKHKAL